MPVGYADSLPFFTQTEFERQNTTAWFYNSSESDMVRLNYFNMFNSEQFWHSEIGGVSYQVPNSAMQEGKTAIQLFRGKAAAWTKTIWDGRYAMYYDPAE